MRYNPEAIAPLLRGIGTMMILVVSILVIQVELREDRMRLERAVGLREETKGIIAAAGIEPSGDLRSLEREVRMLRLQLQHHDLAEEVFSNLWFQLLSLLGTVLIGVSFLFEAWIKRKPGMKPPPPPS